MADECSSSNEEFRVTLFSQNNRVFVWNSDDAYKIRTKYRIVGSLIGSLPRKPRQNACFSLPLVLMAEEATLLLEKGFAKIVDCSEPFPEPTAQQVDAFKKMREASVKDQLSFFRCEREERKAELAEVIEAGRRAKKRKIRKTKSETNKTDNEPPLKASRRNDDENVKMKDVECEEKAYLYGEDKDMEFCENILNPSVNNSVLNGPVKHEIEAQEIFGKNKYAEAVSISNKVDFDEKDNKLEDADQQEMNEKKLSGDLSNADEIIEISSRKSTKVIDNPFIENEEVKLSYQDITEQSTFVNIPTSVDRSWFPSKEFKWTFPETKKDRLNYRVFSDLWEKGYFLTSGGKFGGNYLAYPGDPARFHSFFIIVTVPWGKKVPPCELISMGRLGATVKKTALLCSVNEDDEIVYTSLKWSGIS